ncbi:glycosyltransferase family 39 protein, partial [bacterium]|nr:glycosyltransferase family 39 protein [bacterium]
RGALSAPENCRVRPKTEETILDTYKKLFLITLSAITLFRLFFITQFNLAPDEAYYWTWSRHLDWSYFDQGPMLALIIGFFTAIFGSTSEWSVRLGSVILSVISSWIFFKLVTNCFRSSRAAWYAFLAFQSIMLMSVGAVLMMHDSIMMCFWILCLYFFQRALMASWTPGWLFGSFALGLGALSKYTMALFVPCLLLFLILSPKHRIWWKRPHLYLAGALTLLLISPILIWNIQHDWASFGHVGDLGGAKKIWSFSWKPILNFLGGQLGVISPVLAAFCFYAPIVGWKKWKQQVPSSGSYLYLACFTAPILGFFFLLSWRTEVYANWPAPAYPAAIALLAGWLIALFSSQHAKIARLLAIIGIGLAGSVTFLVHLEAAYNILPFKGRAAQSADRIRGWTQVGKITGHHLEKLKSKSETPVFLAARRYQLAGILSFYTPGQPQVQLLPRLEPANNQYRFWDQSAQLTGYNAVYICEYYWEMEHIKKKFEHIETAQVYPVMKKTGKIREIYIFYAYNFNPMIPHNIPAGPQAGNSGAALP